MYVLRTLQVTKMVSGVSMKILLNADFFLRLENINSDEGKYGAA